MTLKQSLAAILLLGACWVVLSQTSAHSQTDPFGSATPAASPATGSADVTPDDTTKLDTVTRGLWVGTGGDISMLMKDGTTATWANVPDGSLLPVRVQRVNSTGTTASDIDAVY